MSRQQTIALALGACVLFTCSSFADAPAVPTWFAALVSNDLGRTRQNKWVQVDAPLTLIADATERPHLAVEMPVFEGGLIVTKTPNRPPRVMVDFSIIPYRQTPPKGPGPCISRIGPAAANGSGVWAADFNFFYMCVSNTGDPVIGAFVWARVPLQTNW